MNYYRKYMFVFKEHVLQQAMDDNRVPTILFDTANFLCTRRRFDKIFFESTGYILEEEVKPILDLIEAYNIIGFTELMAYGSIGEELKDLHLSVHAEDMGICIDANFHIVG